MAKLSFVKGVSPRFINIVDVTMDTTIGHLMNLGDTWVLEETREWLDADELLQIATEMKRLNRELKKDST